MFGTIGKFSYHTNQNRQISTSRSCVLLRGWFRLRRGAGMVNLALSIGTFGCTSVSSVDVCPSVHVTVSERATERRRPHDSHHSQSAWEFGLRRFRIMNHSHQQALTWNRNTTLREVGRRWALRTWTSRSSMVVTPTAIGRTPV